MNITRAPQQTGPSCFLTHRRRENVGFRCDVRSSNNRMSQEISTCPWTCAQKHRPLIHCQLRSTPENHTNQGWFLVRKLFVSFIHCVYPMHGLDTPSLKYLKGLGTCLGAGPPLGSCTSHQLTWNRTEGPFKRTMV